MAAETKPPQSELIDYHLVDGERILKQYQLYKEGNREEHLFLTDLRVARVQIHHQKKNETHLYDANIDEIGATDTGHIPGTPGVLRALHILMRILGILALLVGIPLAFMLDPLAGSSIFIGGLIVEIGLFIRRPKGSQLVINIGAGVSQIEVNTEEGKQAIKEVSALIRNIQRSNK